MSDATTLLDRQDSPQLAPVAHGLASGALLNSTYRIERLIGTGGMGAVYEARHLRLDRKFAIKVLPGDGEWDATLVARLRLEAAILGRLAHPHIVQISDIDETDAGVPYLVMEYLQGRTLGEHLRREGPLPVGEALRIVHCVAAALSQVHALGMVHCDLKPDNVFLVQVTGQSDFVKVFDFGVSRPPNAARQPLGLIAGTPRYMPPEQALGDPDLDGRTDQFALAAMFYETLSGKPALVGPAGPLTATAFQRVEAPPLSKRAPWIGCTFDTVLQRAMAKNRSRRYPSVACFASALASAARTAGIAVEDEQPPESGIRGTVVRGVTVRHASAPPRRAPRRALDGGHRHARHAAAR